MKKELRVFGVYVLLVVILTIAVFLIDYAQYRCEVPFSYSKIFLIGVMAFIGGEAFRGEGGKHYG